MPGRVLQGLPAPVAALARRLKAYRNNPHRQRRLPEALWRTAAVLARQYGLCQVQGALRLNYHDLKERVAALESIQLSDRAAETCRKRRESAPELAAVELSRATRAGRRFRLRAI